MKQLQIVCMALAGSVAIYIIVGWVAIQQGPLGGANVPATVAWVLLAMGLASMFAAPMVRKTMLRMAKKNNATEMEREKLERSYMTATIVAFVLLESTAIFGLVATILTADITWCAAMCVASLFGMANSWPRESGLEQFLSASGE